MLKRVFAGVAGLLFVSCSSSKVLETGRASYYADKFEGRKTANGEIFSQSASTAAHRTLPFGTKVIVKNLSNGRTVRVRINDRGPFVKGRVIDLSKSAAKKLDMVNAGVANVEVRYKGKKQPRVNASISANTSSGVSGSVSFP